MKKNNATFFKDEKNQLYEHLGPLRRSFVYKNPSNSNDSLRFSGRTTDVKNWISFHAIHMTCI